MPIAAFGVLAATVVGLGALTAADIQSMDELGNRPGPSGWHQPGPHHRLDPRPGEQQFRELPDWIPPGPR
jgi:hypothetical protein